MQGDVKDVCLIPGLGRSLGGGHGNPLQCSCLENPMDRGAWWAAVACAGGGFSKCVVGSKRDCAMTWVYYLPQPEDEKEWLPDPEAESPVL